MRHLEQQGFTNILTARRDQVDLRDQSEVSHWFKANRPEYVFLVAGTVGGILANSTRPAEFIYDNLMIHGTVVHSAYESGATKLLYLGSSCIYPREATQPITEDELLTGPLEATNEWYAIAKIAGIKLCQAYRRQYGCDFISAMPTNLYGPGDNFDLTSSHVIPALMRKFHDARVESTRTGQPNTVTVWGTGAAYREFLHVDDLAAACLFLMENYDDDSPHQRRHRRRPVDPRAGRDDPRGGQPRRRARVGHIEARRHAAQAARRLASAGARVVAQDRAARRPDVDVPVVPRSGRVRRRAPRRRAAIRLGVARSQAPATRVAAWPTSRPSRTRRCSTHRSCTPRRCA